MRWWCFRAASAIILFDEAYWRSIVRFEAFVEHDTIAPSDLDLFRYAETAEEAWAHLVDGGVLERTPQP
jgi:predicted Rossmann-fold nucleotide-binding protein